MEHGTPSKKKLYGNCPSCGRSLSVIEGDLQGRKGHGHCPKCDTFVKVRLVHRIETEEVEEDPAPYSQHLVKIS